VGRVLNKMKGFEGGKEVVSKLLLKYREVYKRRKNMMKVLDGSVRKGKVRLSKMTYFGSILM
jgi:hypothetical protein